MMQEDEALRQYGEQEKALREQWRTGLRSASISVARLEAHLARAHAHPEADPIMIEELEAELAWRADHRGYCRSEIDEQHARQAEQERRNKAYLSHRASTSHTHTQEMTMNERCMTCSGHIPSEDTEMWRESPGDCPGRMDADSGWCGAFDPKLSSDTHTDEEEDELRR